MTGEPKPIIDHIRGHDKDSWLVRIARAMGATAGTFALWIAEASDRLPLAHHPDGITRRHPRG